MLAVVEGVPPAAVLPSLDERELTRWLTEQERAFLADPSDEQALTQLSWRSEGLRRMGWAPPEAWPEEIVPGAVWERRHGLEFLFADTDD